MKKALLTLAVLLASASAFAQGTITFANAGIATGLAAGGTYRVDVLRPDGSGAGAGFTAGLFLVGSSTPIAKADASSGTVTFRTTTSQGVFSTLGTELSVGGTAPGSSANLQLKVWETAAGSWEASAIRTDATAGIFASRPLGGPNPTPGDPAISTPGLTGLLGWDPITKANAGTIAPGAILTITMVPEPSSMALGAVGLGALLLRRRRK